VPMSPVPIGPDPASWATAMKATATTMPFQIEAVSGPRYPARNPPTSSAAKVSAPCPMASERWPPKRTVEPASWATTASTRPTPAANQSTCRVPAGARLAIQASVAGRGLENLESLADGHDHRSHHQAGQEVGDADRLQL